MTKRKLIYLSFIRLTDKVSRDWYIDFCIEKGVLVEYWDIVSLIREEHEEVGALDVDYLRYIKTYHEFEALIQKSENQTAIYVMLISYSGRYSKPFRLLTKHNCSMIFISWGAMPSARPISIFNRVFRNPAHFTKSFFDCKLGEIFRNLKLVKKFDIVFSVGTLLTSSNQYAKRIVHFNLCDFDHYKRVKGINQRVVQGRYAVFLDINLPYQSDLVHSGLSAVNPANYFKSLNRFFDLLEEAHGIKVVIAAHPKSEYINSEFNKRETFRLQTAELVKDSEFVITHNSTALSYAVLNLKPIIFICTSEMMDIYKENVVREIEALAFYFETAVINVDTVVNGNQVCIQLLNHACYENYKYSFLTSYKSENTSSAEIFLNEINAI